MRSPNPIAAGASVRDPEIGTGDKDPEVGSGDKHYRVSTADRDSDLTVHDGQISVRGGVFDC